MHHSFSPIALFLFLFLLGCLFGIVQLGLITITFLKLGISTHVGVLLLLGSLFTSVINIPLLTVHSDVDLQTQHRPARLFLHRVINQFEGKTLIAVNVGGCLIPLAFCLYLGIAVTPSLLPTLVCTACVVLISYLSSRPMLGIGIGMPMLIAPLTAALSAILLAGEERAVVAYIAGTLGVLIGADLLRLKDVHKLGTPLASIGGAGTYDGIFITGLLAVLLT